ncbi:DUF5305 domain-containing protein [Halobaculum halobium]|uniref:DUF5305 family protein n=1 Tax=Halobaculum halobium TaxID=3032281 RepID=A0ABD5T9T5_9EURY|nr:DUF5305 family protein [Halobaculum sp. SYNS20]
MDEATRLRVRSALSSWLTVLLVVSFAIGTAGVWATYTAHVDSGTETVERQTTAWTATGSFDHSATVTRDNPLYPVGTTLTNRSTFFRTVTPVLDGRFTVATPGIDGNASIALSTALLVESTDEETTYWSDSRPLNAVTATSADEPASVAFSVNTSEVADRIAAIEEEVGTAPGETTVAVVVDVEIQRSTTGGATSRLSFSSRLPIALNGDTYTVSGPGRIEEPVQRTVSERVEREYGPIRSIGGPAALVVGLVGIGALGYVAGRERPALTDTERARLEYLNDRSEFDQWIVSVRLPPDARDRPTAEAGSLADLVNLAIDTDNAVLEEPDGDAFHVVSDEYRYTYRAPPPATDGPGLGSTDPGIVSSVLSGALDSRGEASDDGAPSAGDDAIVDGHESDGDEGRDDPETRHEPDPEPSADPVPTETDGDSEEGGSDGDESD